MIFSSSVSLTGLQRTFLFSLHPKNQIIISISESRGSKNENEFPQKTSDS